MERIEAYDILAKMMGDATEEQQKALGIAMNDIEFVDLMNDNLGYAVRCKNCKHEENCMKQLVFWERDHVLEQNVYQYHNLDFCSYGERREDDATD